MRTTEEVRIEAQRDTGMQPYPALFILAGIIILLGAVFMISGYMEKSSSGREKKVGADI